MGYKAGDFELIDQIMDLPLLALKNLTKEDAALYAEVFHVQKISEIAKLDPNHPFNYILPPQTDADIEKHLAKCEAILSKARARITDLDKLRTSILIANMIARAWEKRAEYLSKKDTKVITIGLDNAGKTAILSMLGGKLGIDTIANLKPTKRVERRKISTATLDLFIWDFGGQEDYRKAYLESPEKFFLRTDLMIYVIDLQDPNRFQLSMDYFTEILDIMQRLSENPYILCFLHKADPDLLNDPDFQVAMEFVKEKLRAIMTNRPVEYDMYITSIYNFFTTEPKFSKFIKDVLKDHQSLTDPMLQKVQGLGDIINTTLNGVITLANSIGEQLTNITYRLEALETQFQAAIQSGAIAVLPSTPKEKASSTAPPMSLPANINPAIKQIESKAIESSRNLQNLNLGQMTLNPPPSTTTSPKPEKLDPEKQKREETRMSILKDLQGLFQKAKTLKDQK